MDKDLSGHHVWRQSQTQLNIRNFCRYDSNILNPRVAHFNGGKDNIYRYEFPLMQWTIAMVQKVFGEDILITRLCLFLLGVLTLLGLYQLLYLLGFSPLVSSLGVWTFNFSPVFYYYTINPIPDNLALCSSMWFFVFFVKFYENKKTKTLLLAALMMMLAILAKLPFIVLGLSAFLYFILLLKSKKNKSALKLFLCFSMALIPPLLWYSWVIPSWSGNGVISGVFDNQISFRLASDIIWVHFSETLPNGLLNPIAAFFLLLGMVSFFRKGKHRSELFILLLAGLIGVVIYFLLEINMIHFYHDYYLFPFLPLLILPVVYGLKYLSEQGSKLKVITWGLLLLMPLSCYYTANDYWNYKLSGPNASIYLHQDELKNAVPKGEKCIILNDDSMFVFAYKIDKQGFIFNNDELPTPWIDDMVNNYDVRYMYSDSRLIDERKDVQPYLSELLLERGTIRVYKLKAKEGE